MLKFSKNFNNGLYLLMLSQMLILSAGYIYPQPWRKLTKDVMVITSDSYFINQTTGWYVGEFMTVHKTIDGGRSWTEQYRGSQLNSDKLKSIFFLTENYGFAGGKDAYLLKTTDGGSNWLPVVVSDAVNIIESIRFIDEQRGWVLVSSSNTGAVYKTTDGGSTWTRVLTHEGKSLYKMDFYGTHGVVCGGGAGVMSLYYTADGDNWTKAPIPSLGEISYSRSDIYAIQMINENIIYGTGWGSSVGAQPSLHIKSTDGGASWITMFQTPENKTYCAFEGIYFKDEMNGIAGGGSAYPGAVVVKTTDGGITWSPIFIPVGFSIDCISGIGDNLWAFGGSGNLVYSSDFGNTWELLSETSGHTLYSVKTTDGKTIFAVGMSGLFLKSTDFGKNWDYSFVSINGVSTNILSMCLINNNTLYTGHGYRLACKTTDAGDTWSAILKDSSASSTNNNAVYFFDENTGFIAGNSGANNDIIYFTADGGKTWSAKTGQFGDNINSITFTNSTNGVVGINDTKIFYTNDAGSTWQKSTIADITTDLDINDVEFIDEQKGFAAGQKLLLVTNDGGKNWGPVPGFTTDEIMNDVEFKDADTGYVVGDRYIYKTVDGGTTWADCGDTLITGASALRSICIDDNGYSWICGGSGIAITDAPETPDVSVTEENSPYTFELTQNYPNPFNPSTTINYSVEKRSKVTIKVYDIMGKEVDVLFNGESEAGSHSIKYNAGKLASGVYFCSMQAGNKIKSLKMSLIK